MKILMISLDKNILDKNSRAAQRMIEYGEKDELFIVIPGYEEETLELSKNVHAQSTGGGKLTQLYRLIKMGKKLIKKNNIQEVTTQDPFFTGLAGWCLKRVFKIKLEVQLHGDFLGNYYKKHWLKLFLARFVLKRADRVRVAGERIRQSLIKRGVEESKIEVRPIFVDAEKIKNYQPKIDLRQKYHSYEKIFLVLGRLEPVKNISWLVDVFAEAVKNKSDYLLLIVGDGSQYENLKSKIINLKLERDIKLESWTNDPYSYLKTTNCLLFPSLSEGYGLVPLEAQAAGISVIMNDVGVANYELKPSEKVKILPVNDKEAWIKAILSV